MHQALAQPVPQSAAAAAAGAPAAPSAATPAGAASTLPAATPAPTASGPRFRIRAVELTGATLIGEAEWQAVTASIVGRDIGFAELESARAAIEALFHQRGARLVTVRIPTQETSTGVIRMRAIEPVLAAVKVSGNVHYSAENWLAGFPALKVGSTPDLNAVDRQLTLANESGAKRAQVVFEAGDTPEVLRADIRAQDAPPVAWLAFLDNTGNAQTGKLRYGLAYRNSALWDRDHQLSAQFISAPNESNHPNHFSLLPSDKVQIFGANYRIPLYAQGATVDATVGYSTVNSGTLANLFSVSGRGSIAGVRYTRLTDRVGGWEPRWFIAQDYRKFENRAIFGGVNFAPDIEIHPLSAGLAANRTGEGYSAGLNTSLAANLPGGNKGGNQDFEASRAGASSHYKVLRFGASYLGAFGSGVLNATLDGQWTNDLLIAGEQFGAGGATSVRGFSERFVAGDRGLRFQFEVQSAPLFDAADSPEGNVRAVGFLDGAYLERNRPAVLERGTTSIASVGIGLRAAYRRVTLRLDAARPIVQRTGLSATTGAVHFSLALGF